MIQEIKNNKELIPYLKNEIEDEGIHVEIAKDIEEKQIAIIKVDDYYNGLHTATPPKAVDNLAVVDCECDAYIMYLLELKNVNSPKRLIIKDIEEKFSNTISQFLSEDFGEIFLKDKYKYKKIKLYLISDAYGLSENYKSYEEYKKISEKKNEVNKKDSLRIERGLGSKLFKFRGKVLKICYEIPPNPLIKREL